MAELRALPVARCKAVIKVTAGICEAVHRGEHGKYDQKWVDGRVDGEEQDMKIERWMQP